MMMCIYWVILVDLEEIKIKERVGMDWEWDFMFIEQIAEQLKAGVTND